jgi:hypothetical protein
MDIALGVSVTTTTVHMALVEGAKADGVTIETDAFDTSAVDGAVPTNPSEQVGAAILATRQSARSSGHTVAACGVAMGDGTDVDEYRDSLAARGIDDVVLVSELHAAAALAHAVGRAVGYSTTGLLFLKPWCATLCVVGSADRSMRKVSACNIDTRDSLVHLTDLLKCVTAEKSNPQGLFIVGSGFDLASVKSALGHRIPLPIIIPEDPAWALARGAALVAATAPHFDASTAGLAYTRAPDGAEPDVRTPLPTGPLAPADVVTQAAAIAEGRTDLADGGSAADDAPVRARRPLLSVSGVAASIVVLAAVTLTMAFASTIDPKVNERAGVETEPVLPSPPVMISPIAPPVVTRAAPPPSQAAPAPNVPTSVARPAPAPRTLAAAQTPVRKPQAQTKPAPKESAVAVTPIAATPALADPPPAAEPALPLPVAPPPLPVPAAAPPAPAISPPSPVNLPQVRLALPATSPVPRTSGGPSLWSPPSIWIQQPQAQQPQTLLGQQDPPWLQIPLWPGPRGALPALVPPQELPPSISLLPQSPQSPPQQSNPSFPYSPSPRYPVGSSTPAFEPEPEYPYHDSFAGTPPIWPN